VFRNDEEQQRYYEFLDILYIADKRYLEQLLDKKQYQVEQIDKADRQVIHLAQKKETRRYNLTQAALLLKVHRQTIYYWIKKNWVKPKRDYRNYPVFTVLDIKNIIKWRNSLK
jgi:hypothetical protein